MSLMTGHTEATACTNCTWHMQHRLLRFYAALHLAALYLAAAAALPGLSPWLQPQHAQPLLQALGLWEPSIVASMLPVLGLLVLVSSCYSDTSVCICCHILKHIYVELSDLTSVLTSACTLRLACMPAWVAGWSARATMEGCANSAAQLGTRGPHLASRWCCFGGGLWQRLLAHTWWSCRQATPKWHT